MEYPLASVIIPVYNRAHLIERCLDSVLLQKYRPLEIIVVDNNSKDGSLSTVATWMENHPEKEVTYKTGVCTVQGASAARGFGESMATGDILFFFDSDDTMRPDLVKDAMEVFDRYPETEIVGWRVQFHTLNGTVRDSHAWRPSQSLDYHMINAVLRTQGYAVRKETLTAAGGWVAGIPVWNDWELGVRLLLRKPDIKVLDKIQADVWSQEESITGKDFSSKAGEWERIMDMVENEALASDHPKREHIARLVAYRRAILAAHYKREGQPVLAEELLKKAISSSHLSFTQKQALKLAYRYTTGGLRGAFHIVGPLL